MITKEPGYDKSKPIPDHLVDADHLRNIIINRMQQAERKLPPGAYPYGMQGLAIDTALLYLADRIEGILDAPVEIRRNHSLRWETQMWRKAARHE
jgi:hypothetical protein